MLALGVSIASRDSGGRSARLQRAGFLGVEPVVDGYAGEHRR